MIILFTSNNIASNAIAKALISKHNFKKIGENEWRNNETRLIDTQLPTVLDIPDDIGSDSIIMLSSHKSKTPGKMLTAHIPGNWGDAGMGGEPKTLNIADACLLQKIAKEMKKEADRIEWQFCLEADHHGPTIKIPIMFVEIGNNEEQWRDRKAAEAIANAIVASLGPVENCESVVGFGGGHYQKRLTEVVVSDNIAVGHMAPKYVIDNIDEDMFRQALEKNVEKVTKIVVLKDETNTNQKEKIKKLAEKFNVEYHEVG
ncbi:MAG: D-aminoacyl-tRNA deacylase [Candidatus Micrarchaeota archaeon]